jgi:hypothetical protein
MNTVILIQLLLAHILTDFVCQNQKMVKSKNSDGLKSPYFWMHIALAGAITYVILMQWNKWLIPLFIIITHGVIDYWKIQQEKKMKTFNATRNNDLNKKTGTAQFLLDQLLHLIIIILAWLYLIRGFNEVIPFAVMLITEKEYITIITAIVIIVWPVGITIGKITEPFRKELNANKVQLSKAINSQTDSLNKAGTYIGIFERLLVLIFILMGQYAAIGFLIAAKSVLRISKDGEDDARKKTEYVLIGTLISFTIAILIGLVTNFIISN